MKLFRSELGFYCIFSMSKIWICKLCSESCSSQGVALQLAELMFYISMKEAETCPVEIDDPIEQRSAIAQLRGAVDDIHMSTHQIHGFYELVVHRYK